MKKLVFLIVVGLFLFFASCKTTNNDPTPTPPAPEVLTIVYSVVSTGSVSVDTILYIDAEGTKKYVHNQINFEHSFDKPFTNYNAEFTIYGSTTYGTCKYGLYIIDKATGDTTGFGGNSIHSTTDSIPSSFSFHAESSSSSK